MNYPLTVLHQLDQKIIYPHYDFKHLTEKYFEIGMKLNDFSIQLVKYWSMATAIPLIFDEVTAMAFKLEHFMKHIQLRAKAGWFVNRLRCSIRLGGFPALAQLPNSS